MSVQDEVNHLEFNVVGCNGRLTDGNPIKIEKIRISFLSGYRKIQTVLRHCLLRKPIGNNSVAST